VVAVVFDLNEIDKTAEIFFQYFSLFLLNIVDKLDQGNRIEPFLLWGVVRMTWDYLLAVF
jgi:hypothetical protein